MDALLSFCFVYECLAILSTALARAQPHPCRASSLRSFFSLIAADHGASISAAGCTASSPGLFGTPNPFSVYLLHSAAAFLSSSHPASLHSAADSLLRPCCYEESSCPIHRHPNQLDSIAPSSSSFLPLSSQTVSASSSSVCGFPLDISSLFVGDDGDEDSHPSSFFASSTFCSAQRIDHDDDDNLSQLRQHMLHSLSADVGTSSSSSSFMSASSVTLDWEYRGPVCMLSAAQCHRHYGWPSTLRHQIFQEMILLVCMLCSLARLLVRLSLSMIASSYRCHFHHSIPSHSVSCFLLCFLSFSAVSMTSCFTKFLFSATACLCPFFFPITPYRNC